jgi:glutathione S-transferase
MQEFEHLLQRSQGPYFGGEELSVADCILYPFWERAALCARAFSDYEPAARLKQLAQWAEHVRAHPAAQVACPDAERLLQAVSRTGRLDWFDYETCSAPPPVGPGGRVT